MPILKEIRSPAFIVHVVDRGVALSAAVLAILSLVVLFLSLGAEVIVRYLTAASLGWPSELPMLLFPWLVMGGVVLAAQRGHHVSVKVALQAMNKPSARILMMGIQGVVAVTFFGLAHVGFKVIAITGSEVYPMTGVHAEWAYLSLIFGFVGIGLTALTTFCRLLMGADPHAVHEGEYSQAHRE